MTHEIKEVESKNQIVGPIDRMVRAVTTYLILVVAFSFSFSILERFTLLVLTIYFFFTALSRWDPFYAVVLMLWRNYKDNAAINGRF